MQVLDFPAVLNEAGSEPVEQLRMRRRLAHVAEVGLMYTILRDRVNPTAKDAALVLLYGAFWLKPKLDATRPT